ncbi:MAG: ABC transporter permease [Acetatifactor sp.]
MSRLLRANFTRLWRNRLFWIAIVIVLATAVAAVFNQAQYTYVPDGLLFSGINIISVIAAVFVSIFTGTEYSDGTMRNKLAVGHSRVAVYFANLIVCVAAALIMHIALIAVVVCLGVPVIGTFTLDAGLAAKLFIYSILVVTVYAAIFVLCSMLITSKAAGAITVIFLTYAMIGGAIVLFRILEAPEYSEAYVLDEESGTEYAVGGRPNPRYLTGAKRKAAEWVLDLLPAGEAMRIQLADQADPPDQIPLWAVSVTAVTVIAGVTVFRKKDLK